MAPCFYVLFSRRTDVSPETLETALRDYDDDFADARVEVASVTVEGVALSVRAAGHTVRLDFVPEPAPEPLIEPCIQLAHYDLSRKEMARNHRNHATLEYVGNCNPPLVAHVVLAAMAGVLASSPEVIVANPRARTSVPAELFAKTQPHMVPFLANLPPLFLYAGFAKYEVDGREGIWMRTHGNDALALPDLARHASGHHDGEATFAMFCDTMRHLLEGGGSMSPGDVARIGEGLFTRVRLPSDSESFLAQPSPLLVVDVLTLDELRGRGGER